MNIKKNNTSNEYQYFYGFAFSLSINYISRHCFSLNMYII